MIFRDSESVKSFEVVFLKPPTSERPMQSAHRRANRWSEAEVKLSPWKNCGCRSSFLTAAQTIAHVMAALWGIVGHGPSGPLCDSVL